MTAINYWALWEVPVSDSDPLALKIRACVSARWDDLGNYVLWMAYARCGLGFRGISMGTGFGIGMGLGKGLGLDLDLIFA